MAKLSKALYTAEASVTGGWAGHAISSDGLLSLDLRVPEAMGGPGGRYQSGAVVRRWLRGLLPERPRRCPRTPIYRHQCLADHLTGQHRPDG